MHLGLGCLLLHGLSCYGLTVAQQHYYLSETLEKLEALENVLLILHFNVHNINQPEEQGSAYANRHTTTCDSAGDSHFLCLRHDQPITDSVGSQMTEVSIVISRGPGFSNSGFPK
jgi:hypothetical protein